MKKKGLLLIAVCLVVTFLSGCAGKAQAEVLGEKTTTGSVTETDGKLDADDGRNQVEITIKDYGTITVALDSEHAPVTVANFKKLVDEGFYDGLTFHRVIIGFMIQGGDPLGTGMGGSEDLIKGEFSNNGVDNPLSHTRGAISMARSQEKDSASSQFFIVHQDSVFLDGDYAAFGYVTQGMEVVDKICETVRVNDKNGSVLVDYQPVIETIKLID